MDGKRWKRKWKQGEIFGLFRSCLFPFASPVASFIAHLLDCLFYPPIYLYHTCLPALPVPYRILFFLSFCFFSRLFSFFPFLLPPLPFFACFHVTPSPIAIIIDVGSRISCFLFGAFLRVACYSLLLSSNPVPLPSSPPSVIQPPLPLSSSAHPALPHLSLPSSLNSANQLSIIRQTALESWAHFDHCPQ